MSRKTAALLSIAAFAAGVGAGLVGYRSLGPRAEQPVVHPPPGDGAALPNPPHNPAAGPYTDDEVRVAERWDARDPNDEAFLRVVPEGTAAPLVTVFGALGFDPARLDKPSEAGINSVVFLTWQVSPSYELSCMTATNDPDNEGVGHTDPRRMLYGIRIGKRNKSLPFWKKE